MWRVSEEMKVRVVSVLDFICVLWSSSHFIPRFLSRLLSLCFTHDALLASTCLTVQHHQTRWSRFWLSRTSSYLVCSCCVSPVGLLSSSCRHVNTPSLCGPPETQIPSLSRTGPCRLKEEMWLFIDAFFSWFIITDYWFESGRLKVRLKCWYLYFQSLVLTNLQTHRVVFRPECLVTMSKIWTRFIGVVWLSWSSWTGLRVDVFWVL